MEKELWYKVLDDKEYKIARSAWGFFLEAHGNECDMDGAIDAIAEGVLEIAEKHKVSATHRPFMAAHTESDWVGR